MRVTAVGYLRADALGPLGCGRVKTVAGPKGVETHLRAVRCSPQKHDALTPVPPTSREQGAASWEQPERGSAAQSSDCLSVGFGGSADRTCRTGVKSAEGAGAWASYATHVLATGSPSADPGRLLSSQQDASGSCCSLTD